MNKPTGNKITPIPSRESIVGIDPKSLNQVWEMWFRKLYDVVSRISIINKGYQNVDNERIDIEGFNYTLDGNRFFFNYNGPGDVTINLPFPALFSTSIITAGANKLYIPSTNGTILNDWFFLDIH